jgi:TPP-dependent pyruvate/acetoin dehydrogenase alpha subunit
VIQERAVADSSEKLSRSDLIELYRRMRLIRAFDALLPELYTAGVMRGSAHSAIGQEAVAVGACAALRPDDYITSTHRGHGHSIAKGARVDRMMAELLGRVDGYCRGRGGSMHIADFSIGMLGANGIVGGGIGIAGGAALSSQMLGLDRVALCFFGDGAINRGVFHEVANMAGIWKLPLVFLCENNGWAMSAQAEEMTAGSEIVRRADAYGWPGWNVDGMDVLAVYEQVQTAVKHARSGDGPSLVVAECFRFEGHFSGDTMAYRDDAVAVAWRDRDPLVLFRKHLIEREHILASELDTIERSCDLEVKSALESAALSELPDPASVDEDLFYA